MAWISVEVEMDVFAFELSRSENQEAITKFILELDANVGDVQFTEKLIQQLQESLEGEVD